MFEQRFEDLSQGEERVRQRNYMCECHQARAVLVYLRNTRAVTWCHCKDLGFNSECKEAFGEGLYAKE